MTQVKIENPIPIIGGRISFHLNGTEYIIPVKQVKGQGVHDAIKLKGQPPNPFHLAIMQAMVDKDPMDTTQIRITAKANLYKADDDLHIKFGTPRNFDRPFSELLYWKIVVRVGETHPPKYVLDYERAARLKERVFGDFSDEF